MELVQQLLTKKQETKNKIQRLKEEGLLVPKSITMNGIYSSDNLTYVGPLVTGSFSSQLIINDQVIGNVTVTGMSREAEYQTWR